jgi:IS30 family transposase
MERTYQQLSLQERCSIAQLHEAGQSGRQIAQALGRAPSSIAREVARNTLKKGYDPAFAAQTAAARRWRGSKLERDDLLRRDVLACLKAGWSPQQVEGRTHLVSDETIYRFIYKQIRRTNNFAWRQYLPRAKFKRGYRGRKGGSPAHCIRGRVPISARPPLVGPGHFEADTLLFSRYGQAVLVVQEKVSRALVLASQSLCQHGSENNLPHDSPYSSRHEKNHDS